MSIDIPIEFDETVGRYFEVQLYENFNGKSRTHASGSGDVEGCKKTCVHYSK